MTGSAEHLASTEKARLRRELRVARSAMTDADREEQATALGCVVTAYLMQTPTIAAAVSSTAVTPDGPGIGTASRGTVAAYLAVDPEPGTLSLLGALHGDGFDVVVPVCEAGWTLSWAQWWPGVPLARSVRAPIDEPTGPRRSFGDLEDVRMVLVPALGVDTTGARIGQGGGYYDRFLARYPPTRRAGAPAMGVVYRSEVLPAGSVPVGPFDEMLAGAFTADGALHFEGRRTSG